MCGIAGFVGSGDREDLRAMNAAQAHRGPDADGQWVDQESSVYLGHRRLAIIDLEGGAQPMWTPDGRLGIVFNGEIYNFALLRDELTSLGARFLTDHSDTEVLLHAYRVWGDDFVHRLNGMWALVIYDRNRKRLFGSRDRFGEKPFYYLNQQDLFAFASELTALTSHRQVRTSVSPISIQKYFAYGYIPAPLSVFKEVSKLPGGFNLEYDIASRRLRTWRYWDFVLESDDQPSSRAQDEAWLDELRDLLSRSVQLRLISDVPIGAFVSGGIDSSAVAAYAARALSPGRLETFCIGFSDPSFDESVFARRVAKHIGAMHHERILSIDQVRQLTPQVLSRLDEPMADSSIIPTYLLCGTAREKVTVAIGGDGADELFAGYDPFLALRNSQLYSKLVPKPVHRAISLLAARLPVSHRNMSLDFKVKRVLQGLSFPPALWCPVWMAAVSPSDLAECVGSPTNTEEVYSEAIQLWEEDGGRSLVDKVLRFYTKLYLQDSILCKVDRASMMHSLEVRSPFLDIDLVNFVRKLPASAKFRSGETKWILKRALVGVLPQSIISRPKKGFGIPIGKWFRDGSLTVPEVVKSPVNRTFTKKKLERHVAGKSDERLFLWGQTALNQFLASAPDTAPPELKPKDSVKASGIAHKI
jgi:asparagine synthase (glutamine-hydrolysing)